MSSLEQQLGRIAGLSSRELKAEWQRVTGTRVPRVSPALLRLALGYELQARALGGLPRGVRQTLAQLGQGRTRTAVAGPGTRLVREWQGRVHVVTIGEDEVIRWDGREWRSLSEVARAITGARWSGPAFFGLKQKRAAA